jgi:hypothetical protein
MLSFGNMDKRIHFRFSRRANLQEIITAQNEMPIPSKSIPTISCKRRNFPSKKERNQQLFPFQKESLFFLYPNLVFLTPICLLFSEILLNFVPKSKWCRLWQQNSIL